MGSVRRTQHIECSPQEAWTLIGDPARLHEWFPITSCKVEGNKRWITQPNGVTMEEDIVTLDNALMRFQYSIVNNPMITEHLGTVDVFDDGHGHCIAMYSTNAKPHPLALVIGGAAGEGLTRAKHILEATHGATAHTPRNGDK